MELFCEKGSIIDNWQGLEYALAAKFFGVFFYFLGTTVINNLYWYSLRSRSNVYVEVYLSSKKNIHNNNKTTPKRHHIVMINIFFVYSRSSLSKFYPLFLCFFIVQFENCFENTLFIYEKVLRSVNLWRLWPKYLYY